MHIASFSTKEAAERAAPEKLAAAGPRSTLSIELRYMGTRIRDWKSECVKAITGGADGNKSL
jgi:hypothetical protein